MYTTFHKKTYLFLLIVKSNFSTVDIPLYTSALKKYTLRHTTCPISHRHTKKVEYRMKTIAMQIGFIAACIGGVSAVFGVLYSLYRLAQRIESAIGIDARGRTISERMDKVEYQLWENGGESLADRVNEIGRNSSETAVEVRIIKQVMLQLLAVPPELIEVPKATSTRSKARVRKIK